MTLHSLLQGTQRRRALFALLGPLTALAGITTVSAVYATGCGGEDVAFDEDSSVDSAVDETASDSRRAETDGTVDSTPDARDGADAADTRDSSVADVPDVPPADAPDTRDSAVLDTPDTALLDTPDTALDDAPDTALDADLDVPDIDLDAPEIDGDTDFLETSDAMGPAPTLGSAATFAVLGGSTVTNTGLGTTVNGDLGVSPGTDLTGFTPAQVIGTIYIGPSSLAAAGQASLTTLYGALASAACNTDMTGTDLGGLTLAPGVYCFSSSAAIGAAPLTLDAKGDPNAFWIFQVASTLTTADGSSVIVIGGGSACNVFWQVDSSATLGKTNQFGGNIVAFSSITVQTGSNVSGRALARTGAVTLDTNLIGFDTCTGVVADGGLDAGLDADADLDAGLDADAAEVDGD